MLLKLIEKLKTEWRELVTTENTREKLQFFAICGILCLVSLFMSVMNLITGWHALMWMTIYFTVANLVNVFLLFVGGKFEKVVKVLFSVEIIVLFTMFLVVGEPEGFSALWIPLLPACGILLYKMKNGTIVSLVQFLIIVFFLWTPIGRSFLQYNYTEPFMMRFPVLYVAFYGVGMFFEFLRNVTQVELQKARDKFKLLYITEGDRADVEQQKNIEMVQVLSSEYEAVYYANLETKKIITYTGDGEKSSSIFDNYFSNKTDFEKQFELFVSELVAEEDKGKMLSLANTDSVIKALSKQEAYSLIFDLRDGEKDCYYEIKFISVRNDKNEISAVMVTFADKDYSVRKDREQQMELEKALEKAEAASDAKSKFLFNMSHDIRTPMNAIIGFTDMAKKYDSDKAKVDDCLDKVKLSSTNLLNLINDILDMSRIENNKIDISLNQVNLIDFVNDYTIVVGERAKEKDITTTTNFVDIKHPNVLIDKVQVGRILTNIMGNAIKYTPEGGRASITVAEEQGKTGEIGIYKFIIEDNGIGMTKDFLKIAFDPFVREKSSTVSGIQGTGLGMSITKKLVSLMNGDIDIQSKPGVGTKVTIILPLAIQNDAVQTEKGDTVPEDYGDRFKDKKVLLVEDNELNMEIAVDLLADEGFVVETASDGDVAVDMLREKGPLAYDIVLMDIQMPRMNGYDATSAIRKMDGFDKLPIIALTANAFEDDKKKAIVYGMNGHLAKPIEIDKMKQVLGKFL